MNRLLAVQRQIAHGFMGDAERHLKIGLDGQAPVEEKRIASLPAMRGDSAEYQYGSAQDDQRREGERTEPRREAAVVVDAEKVVVTVGCAGRGTCR